MLMDHNEIQTKFPEGDPQPERPIITVDLAEPTPGTCEMTFHCVLHGLGDGDGSGIEDGWTQAFAELAGVLVKG